MTPCVQCGRPRAARVGRSWRTLRMACPGCGAVFRSPRGAAEAPATADPLTAVLPEAMARWLREEHPGQDLTIPADRPGIAEWYDRFDRFTRAALDSPAVRARYDTLGAGPPRARPAFNKVLTALQSACFDQELAARRLDSDDTDRIAQARRWLAGPGRATAWITAEPPLLDPDPALARTLLEPGALTGAFDRARSNALHAALFGVKRGPQLRLLVEQFTEQRLQEAVAEQLRDGSRPLREAVLTLLEDGAG